MATKKISELEAINAAEDNDVLVIVDTSESTTNKITKGNLLIGAGHTIEMTLNENYQIVLVLKNAAGTALSTQTIDLPNENAVTNLAYNNGILTVTKQSGATSQINLTGLIEGLVTESDFNTFKEALQATLEAINEKDAEQDEAIAENYKVINKLNEKLENQQKVIDQLPQVTGQGTSITLENTIEAPFTKFEIEGNSEQESTKGYQLLPKVTKLNGTIRDITTTGGITYTNLGGGHFHISGTATETTSCFIFGDTAEPLFVPAGSYTISSNNLPDGVKIITSGSGNNGFVYTELSSSNPKVTSSVTDDTKPFNYIVIRVLSGTTVNTDIYFMLESGTTAHEWEPFTNGASPNPNYEQPIYSAGDNENIWNGEIERGAINGDGLDVDATNRVRNVGYYELNKGTYTLSYKGAEQSVVYIFNANKVKVNNPSWENGKSTFTLEENGYIKYALKQSDNREMNVNDVSKIKLEKGNKATPYSPYGMGSINEKIINKNVWNIDKFKNLYGTNTYETYNNVECLKLAGATQRYNFQGEENTQYTFQFKLIGSTLNNEIGAFSLVYSDGTSDYHDGILTPKTYTFTSKANKTLVRIVWNAWNAGNFIYIDKNSMQLEPGSTASPYVEHEEQDYSIPVQQPMRSIGDIRDCFVKKSDGWYERHYISKVVLDGSENWNYEGGRFVLNFLISALDISGRQKVYSNYFEYLPSGSADYGIFVYKASSTNSQIYILDKDYTTVEGFKAMLAEKYASGNPVYVNYLLAEPLDLPCTEEQVEQLENKPSTYKDFTIINSEDETEAYLEVSGIYDLNKLITRTEVLESEV